MVKGFFFFFFLQDGFADFFPEQGLVEDKLWKGLVFAAVGLGALAIVAH